MNQDIYITPEDLKDQKERMVEEYDVPEEEAEAIYKDMKTYVMLQSQELGKDWGDEAVNAITNLLISIQNQVNQQRFYRRQLFFSRLYNLVSGVFIGLSSGIAGAFFFTGNYFMTIVALTVAFALIVKNTSNG